MSQETATAMINEVLPEATLNEPKVIIKRKYNKKVKLVEEPVAVEVDEKVVEAVVEAEVLEVIPSQVVDYDSDDDEELDRIIAEAQRKKELKRQKKLQENKAEEWEEKKEPLFISAIHNDMRKLVEFAKKSKIPLTLLSMGIDLTEDNAEIAYHYYEQEQMESDYPQVKDNFFTPPKHNAGKKKTTRRPNIGATDYIAPVRVNDGTRTPQNIMVSGEELRFKHQGEYFQFTYTGSNEFLYKGETYKGLNKAVVSIQALENMGYKKNAWNVWDHVEIYRQETWGSVKKLPLL
jgi:hypothetical protein